MKKYLVRVTRDADQEWVDIEIEADDENDAKKKAVAVAWRDESLLFGPVGDYRYYVDPIDEVEEIPEEGFC